MSHHMPMLVLAVLAVLAAHNVSGQLSAAEPANVPAQDAVTANNDFGADLYRQLAAGHQGKNLFFSPYSMSVALTMTAEGARGETALQMGRALRYPNALRRTGEAGDNPWDLARIHKGLATLSNRFNSTKPAPKDVIEKIARVRAELKAAEQAVDRVNAQDFAGYRAAAAKVQKLHEQLTPLVAQVDPYELRVANALWAEQTYPFQQSYLDTIRTYYGTGGAFPVDFIHNAAAVRERINRWVEEQTRDRIKTLIPPGALDRDTRLVLTNAVYFMGAWDKPFDARFTKDQPFFLADGKTVAVPLMCAHEMKSVRYGAFNGDGTFFDSPEWILAGDKEDRLYPGPRGFLALEVPYKGNEISMVLLVPQAKEGLASAEKLLSAATLQGWMAKLKQRSVKAFVPRFKLETDYAMKPPLEGLGMVRAFDPYSAQFEGMSPRKELYIAKVLHKAFVDVNEEGTEAAAATMVEMALMSAPVGVPFVPTVRADRPFVFLIRERKTGCVLFLGRITNPKA